MKTINTRARLLRPGTDDDRNERTPRTNRTSERAAKWPDREYSFRKLAGIDFRRCSRRGLRLYSPANRAKLYDPRRETVGPRNRLSN